MFWDKGWQSKTTFDIISRILGKYQPTKRGLDEDETRSEVEEDFNGGSEIFSSNNISPPSVDYTFAEESVTALPLSQLDNAGM